MCGKCGEGCCSNDIEAEGTLSGYVLPQNHGDLAMGFYGCTGLLSAPVGIRHPLHIPSTNFLQQLVELPRPLLSANLYTQLLWSHAANSLYKLTGSLHHHCLQSLPLRRFSKPTSRLRILLSIQPGALPFCPQMSHAQQTSHHLSTRSVPKICSNRLMTACPRKKTVGYAMPALLFPHSGMA